MYIDIDAKREGVVHAPDADAAAVAASIPTNAPIVRQESLSPIISPAGAGNGAAQRQWRSGTTGGNVKKCAGWGEGSLRW